MLAIRAKPFGQHERYGLFRTSTVMPSTVIAVLLLRHPKALQDLLNYPPPKMEQAEAMLECTILEQNLGVLSDFKTAEQMDALYGANLWAFMLRFGILTVR